MRISDWSSDVCSSDLHFPCKDDIIVGIAEEDAHENLNILEAIFESTERGDLSPSQAIEMFANNALTRANEALSLEILAESYRNQRVSETIHLLSTRYRDLVRRLRSEEHPSELQSLMRISY